MLGKLWRGPNNYFDFQSVIFLQAETVINLWEICGKIRVFIYICEQIARCTTVWVRACEQSVACSRPFPYRSTRASLRILSPPWHSRTSSLHFSSHFLYEPHLVHTYHKYFRNSDCRWQIPSKTPSHPTVPLTDPLKDPLTPHSPAHRSLQTSSHLTDFSQILITDFSQIYLGFRAWAPGTPHHESFHNVFQLWCIIEAAGFCGWWPQIAILPSKLQIFSQTASFAWWKESLRNLQFTR